MADSWTTTVVYLILWVVIVVIARYLYKRRKATVADWFEENPERVNYNNLLETKPDDTEALRVTLLKRAMIDMKRAIQLNEEKQSLSQLVKNGAISDEMWASFKKAENDLQLEIYEVQAEAETFKEGWGDKILQDAAILIQRERQIMMMMESQMRAAQAEQEKNEQKDDEDPMEKSKRLERELIEEEEREKGKEKAKNAAAVKK